MKLLILSKSYVLPICVHGKTQAMLLVKTFSMANQSFFAVVLRL